MNSFKEKFKIAKILASLFTHSSTPEEEKNYRAWLDKKLLFTKGMGQNLSATRRRKNIRFSFMEKESEICGSSFAIVNTDFIPYL